MPSGVRIASTASAIHNGLVARHAPSSSCSGAPGAVRPPGLTLPGGLGGAGLAGLARELGPNLPVVYASGSFSRIEELDAVAGAIFVPKPYNPDKLCEMLSEMTSH